MARPTPPTAITRARQDALIQGVIAAGGGRPHRSPQSHQGGVQLGLPNGRCAAHVLEPPGSGRRPAVRGRASTGSEWTRIPGPGGRRSAGAGSAAATGHFMDAALSRLRSVYMPLAGIPRSVPLVITENGYPTGPGRTTAMQVTVMRAAVTRGLSRAADVQHHRATAGSICVTPTRRRRALRASTG